MGEFFAQGGHAFGRHRVDRRIHSSAVFQTDENRVRNEREEMGRRTKREAVRRPSNVRGRGVGENERTLRERTRGVVDAGFESESEPVVRVAKFIEVPEGWKGTKEEVDLEYQKHKEIGEKTGCWKSGTLVEDDDGSVAKLLKERELAGQ